MSRLTHRQPPHDLHTPHRGGVPGAGEADALHRRHQGAAKGLSQANPTTGLGWMDGRTDGTHARTPTPTYRPPPNFPTLNQTTGAGEAPALPLLRGAPAAARDRDPGPPPVRAFLDNCMCVGFCGARSNGLRGFGYVNTHNQRMAHTGTRTSCACTATSGTTSASTSSSSAYLLPMYTRLAPPPFTTTRPN